MKKWNEKYENLSSILKNKYSLEFFLWAMEAVHSRAFCGNFGPLVSIGRTPVLAVGLVEIAAAIAGVNFKMQGTPWNDTDPIVLACAIVAALPIFLLTLIGSSGGDAVLLPMIDSANHYDDADSLIEYDPFQDGFGLKLGNKCLGKEDGQVFISYGKNKSDTEWLLNYGFLPGVSFDSDSEEENRLTLANAFLKRN